MPRIRPLPAAFALLLATSLHAQPAQPVPAAQATSTPALPGGPGWLDSEAAEDFRRRVILLALLHDESNGLDPHGYMVTTRKLGQPEAPGCWRVQVVTSLGGEPVRRDTVSACKP